jgi:hypothetical protein
VRILSGWFVIAILVSGFGILGSPTLAQSSELACTTTIDRAERIEKFSYNDGYAMVWQSGVARPEIIDGQQPDGQFVVICLQPTLVSNVSDREEFLSEAFMLAVDGRYETRLERPDPAFITDETIAALQSRSRDQEPIVLVYDIGLNWNTDRLVLTDLDGTKLHVFLEAPELSQADATEVAEPEDEIADEPESEEEEDLGITDWGETGLVGIFPTHKWSITFDSYEVRYFIGDQSIVPQRGQFLVIWFTQSSQDGSPLPMGNFELTAWAAGEDAASGSTYSISREGTAALILTEYNWNPGFMSRATPYRTGVVFDIRPEDTEFLLRFPVPNDPIRPDPINLRFTA